MITAVDLEEMYVDQAMECSWPISSCYTPYGIKRIDGEYCRRICEGKEDKQELQAEIQDNPHLHQTIKNNLIYNLYNR